MQRFSGYSILVLVLLQVITVTRATQYRYQYPYVPAGDEERVGHREGKILPFWDDLERGLKDTADIVSRVSDNLEVTFDQISGDLEDNISSFTDQVGKRMHESISPYLRQEERIHQFPVDAISGSIRGVDDGLTVFYPDENEPLANAERIDVFPPTPEENPNEGTPSLFRPFYPFGGSNLFKIFTRSKPWWQSQNVCVEREEVDEREENSNGFAEDDVQVQAEVETTAGGSEELPETETSESSRQLMFSDVLSTFRMSSCKDSRDKYTCVTRISEKGMFKTVKTTHRCCHGFVRDGHGCSKIEIFSMPETLEELPSATDFLLLAKAADLTPLLTESNLTIFVPINEAFQEFTADMEEKNEIQNSIKGRQREQSSRQGRHENNLAPVLRAHITEGFLYAGDFVDEQVLPSLNEGSTLRINTYPGFPTLVTVNCARVISANHHSENGVVHTIDRVLSLDQGTIADILDDPQFTILNQLLKNTGIMEELRQDGQLTFLAPTDAAFKRLPQNILDSLLQGRPCLEAVIKHHILPNTICSAAIQGRMKTENLIGDFMVVKRTEEDKLFVEDAQIVAKDVIASNGVVHIVDKVLIPNQAKSVSDVLTFHNLTKFLDLLEAAELLEEFDTQNDITVFAPTNGAFDRIPQEEFEDLKNDKDQLKELLRYHVTSPTLAAQDINNNHILDTVAGHPLRMNLYSGSPMFFGILGSRGRRPVRVTAGCSRVSLLDSRACGAVVHILEDVLQVPQSSIMDNLDQEHFSIFKKMVKDSGMDNKLSEDGPFTLLAPSDHAFKTLPEEELKELLENEELRKKIVQRHALQEHVCCTGINPNNWLFMDRKRTLDDGQVHLRRSPNGRIMAGQARITECGSPTGNGIIHTVNRMVVDEREIDQMMGQETENNRRVFHLGHLANFF